MPDGPQATPGGIPQGRLVSPEVSDVGARQMQGFGQALEGAGQSMGKIADDIQARADQTVAKAGDVQAMEAASKLLYDPKGGYLNTRGDAAIKGYEVAQQGLRDQYASILDGIPNPRARAMLEPALAQRMAHARQQMDMHAGTQERQFRDNTANARAVVSYQTAAQNFTDDKGWSAADEVARNETRARAQINGWDETTEQLQFQQYRDTGLKARYDAWSVKDPQAALAHYLKNAAQLSPGFQDDVGNKLFLKAKSLLAMEVNANGGVGFAPAQGGAAGAAGASTGSGDLSAARGLRNNNPGNIVKSGIQWAGQVDGNDPRFASFATPEAGIAALGKNLLAYQGKYGLNTVQDIIARWAPATENNTSAYVAAVAKEMGVKPDAPLNLCDAATLSGLTRAIVRHENGKQPYDDATLGRGLSAALGQSSLPAAATRAPALPDLGQATTGLPLIDGLPPQWKQEVLHLAATQAKQSMAAERQVLDQRVKDSSAEYMANGFASNPPGEGAFIRAYGQDEGVRRFREQQGVAALGQNLQQLKEMPAAGMAELVKASKPQPGVGFAARQQNYDILLKAVDHVNKARANDPVAFALQAGAYGIQPIAKPDDLGALGQEMARRASVAPQMARDYGTPVNLLTDGEAKGLTALLRTQPVEQQKKLLGAMAQGVNNLPLYKAALQAIAPDMPTVALAGLYQASGYRTTQGHDTADLILRGQAILTPPDAKEDGSGHAGGKALVKMPEAKLMLSDWNSVTGSAFKGSERAADLYLQTARVVYAAKSAEDGDYSGVLNAGRWKSAIQIATGGIENHNGSQIVLPYGKPYSQFRDYVGGAAPQAIKAAGGEFSAGGAKLAAADFARMLPGAQLQSVQGGGYWVRAGNGVVMGANGRPYLLQVPR